MPEESVADLSSDQQQKQDGDGQCQKGRMTTGFTGEFHGRSVCRRVSIEFNDQLSDSAIDCDVLECTNNKKNTKVLEVDCNKRAMSEIQRRDVD
jgi:hypothetical protein